jgi:hypothetical protein
MPSLGNWSAENWWLAGFGPLHLVSKKNSLLLSSSSEERRRKKNTLYLYAPLTYLPQKIFLLLYLPHSQPMLRCPGSPGFP